MAVIVNVNGGTVLTLGTGTPQNCEQQLSTAEIPTEQTATKVGTYGGSSVVTGQPQRTLHVAGYQDWNAAGSVCQYLEENVGIWVPVEFWQYGKGVGDIPDVAHPKVTGEVLCVAPKRGGVLDEPETFDITMGIRGYTVTAA